MLPQILRKPLAELLGHSVFPDEVGRDLGARNGETLLASATYEGLAVAVYMQIAAGQDGRCRVTIHDAIEMGTRQVDNKKEHVGTAGRWEGG